MISESEFQQDYKFILHGEDDFFSPKNYEEKNDRLHSIIEKYENIDSHLGKYAWVTAHAYIPFTLASYRIGVIRNFEKYLTLSPFVENFADTLIHVNHTRLQKFPQTKQELIQAEHTHFRNVYYFLGKYYEKENCLDEALKFFQMGINIIPEEKYYFAIELYEVYRKLNQPQKFLEFCDLLPPSEKSNIANLIYKTKENIAKGYIFKPRRNNNLISKN